MKDNVILMEIDKPLYETIQSVQYDRNSRFVHVKLLNNSLPFDLTNKRVILSGSKPDGEEIFNTCKIEEDLVIIEITEEMNAVPGISEYSLEIYGGDMSLLQTKNFKIKVTPSVRSKKVESRSEVKALTDALSEVQNIDNRFAETNAQLSETNKQVLNNKEELNDKIQEVASTGTTIEVLQSTTESYIQNKIDDGTIANLTIENDSITEDKIKFYSQNRLATNGVNLNCVVYDNYVDVRFLGNNNTLYYYHTKGTTGGRITLDNLQYYLSQYSSLIWNLIDDEIEIIADGQYFPQKYVLLLHFSIDTIDGGALLSYVNAYKDKKLLQDLNNFCYFEKPYSLYISTPHVAIKDLWVKWEGNLTIRSVNQLIATDSYQNIIGYLDPAYVATSLNENKNCIKLGDGECLVYRYAIEKFYVCQWQEYDYDKHLLLVRNTDGKAIDGLLVNHYYQLIKQDTRIEFDKIPTYFVEYIENKKNELILMQNNNTTMLAHISDIHSTEYTGYKKLTGLNVLKDVCQSVGIQAICNTGDSTLYEESKQNSVSNGLMVNRKLSSFKLLNAIGNHDSNGWDSQTPQPFDTFVNDKELYATYGQIMNDYVVFGDKVGMYYYYDVPNSKIRVITLNSCDIPYIRLSDGNIKYNPNLIYNYSKKQLEFLAESLKTDRHVLISCHIPLFTDSDGMVANYTMPHNNEAVIKILKAFKDGTSFNHINQESDFEVNISGEFSTMGNLIGVISGHIHYDCLVTKDGINHVSINCELMHQWIDSQPERVFGTTSQFCFDVYTIDTVLRTVKLSRFGVGNNREFTY